MSDFYECSLLLVSVHRHTERIALQCITPYMQQATHYKQKVPKNGPFSPSWSCYVRNIRHRLYILTFLYIERVGVGVLPSSNYFTNPQIQPGHIDRSCLGCCTFLLPLSRSLLCLWLGCFFFLLRVCRGGFGTTCGTLGSASCRCRRCAGGGVYLGCCRGQ